MNSRHVIECLVEERVKMISNRPRQGYQRLIIGFLSLLGGLAVLVVASVGCSGSSQNNQSLKSQILTNSVVIETTAAGDYLLSLYQQQKLPGAPSGPNYTVSSEEVPATELNQLQYPFSRTFYIWKPHQAVTNYYIVTKQSLNSAWRLQRAWKLDSKGSIIGEWPVN